MKHRISQKLARLKEELRKRAVKEKDEELRDDYWRLYYAARDAEYEVRQLISDAETRNVLEVVANYGLLEILMEEERNNPPPVDETPKQSYSTPTDYDDEIPPRQLGLWD
jgi:hypothetical protein